MSRTRLRFSLALTGMVLIGSAEAQEAASVFKTSGCVCCVAWTKHLEKAGFKVAAKNLAMGDLMQLKLKSGLKVGQTSCHTAKDQGLRYRGPRADSRDRAPAAGERPAGVVGLAVPNMPLGSPGMEYGEKEAYDVLLFRSDGSTEIYASYGKD